MSVIVTDTGFGPDDRAHGFYALENLPANDCAAGLALDLPNTADPTLLIARFGAIDLIRIGFASFADGRGFTLARRLRSLGYQGRLRAQGHVLADQYAMARRAGFDEVEIDDALARRQPEADWLARARWQAHDYQARLRANA